MKLINNDKVHDQLLKNNQLPLAFDPSLDYEEWKNKVAKKYAQLLKIDTIESNVCALNFEIEEKVETKEYTRYRFTFEAEKDCIVPCYLLIPKTNKAKYPVCICLQGHTPGMHISIGIAKKEEDNKKIESNAYALFAVQNGYAALCIEQRGMGERQPASEYRQYPIPTCYFPSMTALILGRTIIGERVWDISKAIDCLENFRQLDLEDITCLGHSGGGTATYYATCYDKRIKTAVCSCCFSTFRESIGELCHCACNYIPDIATQFDMAELSCLIAPRTLILQCGGIDTIFSIKGARQQFEKVKQIYEKAGAKDNCFFIETDTGHKFRQELVFPKLKKMRENKNDK